ncbi:MAG TPA: lysine-sensitive aspartokinase 3 [Terriglobales bacterium]|nr:lysine-sensitive aspartokinase 3 [Terriglobales bacterium]
MIVMKFGGTSVENGEAIERVAEIVGSRLDEKPVVVVSALARVTDALVTVSQLAASGGLAEGLRLHRQMRQRHFAVLASLRNGRAETEVRSRLQALFDSLEDVLRGVAALGELSPRTSDNLLSFGEVLSTHLVTAAFRARGMDAVLVDSRQLIVTDASYNRAVPQAEETNRRLRQTLKPLLDAGQVPVMAGFIAATAEGIPTTLGRGGSDFSAAIVGAGLGARKIEIWTDVEGMMTTDPRVCPDARRIDVIGFNEASELAYFGAKVLHPATVIPAIERNIPLYILNSRNPDSKGTCIRAHARPSKTILRSIAAKRGVKVINVRLPRIRLPRILAAQGFLHAVFEAFDHHVCPADLVSTSEVSVSVAVEASRDLDGLVQDLKRLGNVEVENNKAIICLVGEKLRGRIGVAASVFNVLASAGINVHMISQGASEINISFVIEERDIPEAVRHLHSHFFAERAGDPPWIAKQGSRRKAVPRHTKVNLASATRAG